MKWIRVVAAVVIVIAPASGNARQSNHASQISARPNIDEFWAKEKVRLGPFTHAKHEGPGDDTDYEAMWEAAYREGARWIVDSIENSKPVSLKVGIGRTGKRAACPVNEEFGLPQHWVHTKHGLEDMVGAVDCLRWYAERGIYPVNSSKRKP